VSDEDYSKYAQFVKEQKIDDIVSFQGPLKLEETIEYYHRADAFVLYSKYETFSIVIAEAWATGTPIITTKVGIASDMPLKSGVNIEHDNDQELAEVMLSFIEQGIKFDKVQIREYAKQFGNDEILSSWTDLIER
ncbi:MAG: glycosyltransferase, partial [Flavobacteriales bacterium]